MRKAHQKRKLDSINLLFTSCLSAPAHHVHLLYLHRCLFLQCPPSCLVWLTLPPTPTPLPSFPLLSPARSGYYCCITSYPKMEQLKIAILFCSYFVGQEWERVQLGSSHLGPPTWSRLPLAGRECCCLKARQGWLPEVTCAPGWQLALSRGLSSVAVSEKLISYIAGFLQDEHPNKGRGKPHCFF